MNLRGPYQESLEPPPPKLPPPPKSAPPPPPPQDPELPPKPPIGPINPPPEDQYPPPPPPRLRREIMIMLMIMNKVVSGEFRRFFFTIGALFLYSPFIDLMIAITPAFTPSS